MAARASAIGRVPGFWLYFLVLPTVGPARTSSLDPMKILTRYIVRQIAVPTLLALVLVGFLGVASEVRSRVADFRGLPFSEITLGDAVRLTLLFLPAMVSFVVPITFMMGILMAFSRLAHQNEITAMKAAGIPLKRLLVPVLVLGALLSIAMFEVQDRLQPWALRQINEIIYSDLPLRATLDVLPAGVMHNYEDWRVYIGHRDAGGTLHDIRILEAAGEGPVAFYAASAHVIRQGGQSRLVMHDVLMIPSGQALVTLDSHSIAIPPLKPRRVAQVRKTFTLRDLLDYETLVTLTQDLQGAGLLTDVSLKALGDAGGVMAATGFPPEITERYPSTIRVKPEWIEKVDQYRGVQAALDLAKTRWDIAERTAIPFSCFAVCLAAAPLAVRNRGGGRSYAFVVGLVVLGAYFLLFQAMQPTGLHSLPTMLIKAWTPNLVLMAAGLYFLWQVDRV